MALSFFCLYRGEKYVAPGHNMRHIQHFCHPSRSQDGARACDFGHIHPLHKSACGGAASES
jgi:hypothetical protein